MSHPGTVAWLALRELWISFRLLVVLFAHVAAGAVVALVPAGGPETVGRLAVGLGAATTVTAVVAAGTMADERLAGRAGFLVTRSVSRGSFLAGWFCALALVALAGVAAAGLLGWLALGTRTLGGDPLALPATLAAIGTTTIAAAALGLLAGAILGVRGAIVAALVACAAAGTMAWLTADAAPWAPGAGHVLLARLAQGGAVLPDALRAAGIGLALGSALLVAARLALERSDL